MTTEPTWLFAVVRQRAAADPPAEAPSHAHQVGVVQFLLRTHPEVRVQDDAIDAVVAAFQQVP